MYFPVVSLVVVFLASIIALIFWARDRRSIDKNAREDNSKLEIQELYGETALNEIKLLQTLKTLGINEDPIDYLIAQADAGKLRFTPKPDGTVSYIADIGGGIKIESDKIDFSKRPFLDVNPGPILYTLCFEDAFADTQTASRFERYWYHYFDVLDENDVGRGDERAKKLFEIAVSQNPNPRLA